jgi:hypothetical protein
LIKFLKNNKKKNSPLPGEIYVKNLGETIPTTLFNNYHSLNIDHQSYIFLNNKEEEQAIKNIISDELEETRTSYQSVTKKTISQKTLWSKNLFKIEELKKEIENLKYPQTAKSINPSELSSKNNLNTTPSTLKPKQTKETFMATRTLTMYNISKNEEILKELKEDLQAVKKIRDDLSNKIESQKKINEKSDKEVSDLNNELSDKFSLIYQLETQLEKLKKKKKKKTAV